MLCVLWIAVSVSEKKIFCLSIGTLPSLKISLNEVKPFVRITFTNCSTNQWKIVLFWGVNWNILLWTAASRIVSVSFILILNWHFSLKLLNYNHPRDYNWHFRIHNNTFLIFLLNISCYKMLFFVLNMYDVLYIPKWYFEKKLELFTEIIFKKDDERGVAVSWGVRQATIQLT